MFELTLSHAATTDRLESELAAVCRIALTLPAGDDLLTLERYRLEIEAELIRLGQAARAA